MKRDVGRLDGESYGEKKKEKEREREKEKENREHFPQNLHIERKEFESLVGCFQGLSIAGQFLPLKKYVDINGKREREQRGKQ